MCFNQSRKVYKYLIYNELLSSGGGLLLHSNSPLPDAATDVNHHLSDSFHPSLQWESWLQTSHNPKDFAGRFGFSFSHNCCSVLNCAEQNDGGVREHDDGWLPNKEGADGGEGAMRAIFLMCRQSFPIAMIYAICWWASLRRQRTRNWENWKTILPHQVNEHGMDYP